MLRHAFWLIVAAVAVSACSLIVAFDPDAQPCDSTGACLPTHVCVDGICKSSSSDGGAVADAGANPGTETDCANGRDDDGDTQVDCADSDCATKSCSDGDACTTGDVCNAGVCQRGTPMSCNSPSACQATPGTCDAGTCVYAPLADGVVCGAGSGGERCCAGACVNITTDSANCGGCGLTCSGGQTCQDVSTTCGPRQTSGRCTCASACPTGQTCGAGVCSPVGDAGCSRNQRAAGDPGCRYCTY